MKKGDIVLVELPLVQGHEQVSQRPALLLSETEANIAIVIPFTSNVQALRFPHTVEIKPSKMNGLNANSIALVFHIRAIDKSRIKKHLGTLENQITKQIDQIIKKMISLN